MKKVIWPKLIASIILCQFAGIVGSVFTMPAIPTWYQTIIKPSFNPPSWVFGPVWTTLFTLMGISLYLIWISKSKLKMEAIKIFVVQLIFNILWSVIFFGMRNPGLAYFEILILLSFVLATIIKFYKINKVSAYLLIPYFLWGSFATFLNYTIWILNK